MKRKKIRVYLSGGMEYAKNEGVDWREDLELWLRSHLNHSVFNPNVESQKYLRKVLPDKNFRKLKSSDIEAYIKIVKHFVRQDSKEIALHSDYVICLWNSSAQKGAGTKGELTIAKYFGKPVYFVSKISRKNIPGWVIGCTTKLFTSFVQLKDYLQQKYAS
jgi:hypothetical protein